MIFTKYDPNSHSAVSASFTEIRHLIALAVFLGTAPVLGPAAYIISRFFSAENQGAAFIGAWVILLFGTCVVASVAMAIRGFYQSRRYQNETDQLLGRGRIPTNRFWGI